MDAGVEDHAPMYEPRIPTMIETVPGGVGLFKGQVRLLPGRIWGEKIGRTSFMRLVCPFLYSIELCFVARA